MKDSSRTKKLLENLNGLHLEGKRKAFELGHPYYSRQYTDGKYFRKELPTGEVFFALVEFKYDEKGYPIEVIDTYLQRICP